MSFAIIRVQKVKSFSGIGRHVDRVDAHGENYSPDNADKKKINSNIYWDKDGRAFTQNDWRNQIKGKSLGERVKKRIDEGYKVKKAIRKDAVKALEYLLTSDNRKMQELEKLPERFKDWLSENRKFIENIHGKENIVAFSLHRDEETPHLHVVVVPLTKEGRLTMEPYVGSPRLLVQLQNQYSQSMKRFGMERGIRGSRAHHEAPDRSKSLNKNVER
ncbi:MAG TPA: MobV family relaxase [Cyclobacteriaceae bacterium]|nr:MobV family relaxase [Cyclobacteriaceae bacterium]